MTTLPTEVIVTQHSTLAFDVKLLRPLNLIFRLVPCLPYFS